MASAVGSVVVAAAQSVAKVYAIGGIGYAAVKYPKNAPLLPSGAVGTIARFGFNVLTISLIFSTIASSVTIDSLGNYWFVVVGAVGVLAISFATATILSKVIPIRNPSDFNALRIAATFPNIVALPILIFPSLCEYPVVYEAFGKSDTAMSEGGEDRAQLFQQCVAKSNTMIFCYFFGWSLLFWSFGHPTLLTAAENKSRTHDEQERTTQSSSKSGSQAAGRTTDQSFTGHTSTSVTIATDGDIPPEMQSTTALTPFSTQDEEDLQVPDSPEENASQEQQSTSVLSNIQKALKQTFTSPPFVAMILAFCVGCISPVRDLLFSQGGALRFLGAAVETLGQASSPMSTMVVAASLASRRESSSMAEDDISDDGQDQDGYNEGAQQQPTDAPPADAVDRSMTVEEESPVMSDPNFGPLQLRRRSSIHRFGASLRQSSIRAMKKARRTDPEQRRLYIWFTLSRLILSPALVTLAIVGLDCSGISGIPHLAKLVLIVNSSVPGALIVVVLLKSNPLLHETAAVVAKVYFPTYILSIVTIAAWTAVGLIVSIPDEDGNSFCSRYR
ncbi:expressed unknown protein [Seminavis robusta]|uniref:Uncharacterized protein n=1 Tax=Seminavis robusta TaxID=568900 RepID=A0A9N8D4R5_9STRA|nr:expressed unknown protein [Seminavis robusta]|eukprot:Sro4_g003580.1 n/a (559) ;mRNA; f:194737-196523